MLNNFLKEISFKDVRRAVMGLTVLFGGLGLAGLTLWAHRTGNSRLAGGAAIISLVFVVLILIFVVPPLARNATKEFSAIDLPLELTSGGLIYLGVTGIVGFAAWNTGNNLLFLVLAFLLAAMIVAFFLGGANLKKLEAKVRFPEAIFAEQTTAFAVALNNRKSLLPTFSVTLALRGTLTDDPFNGRKFLLRPPEKLARFFRLPWLRRSVGYFIFVSRKSESEQQTEQVFAARGRFVIKDFELSTKFPFGFWHHRRRLKVRETEIFVFPPLAEIKNLLPRSANQIGQQATARRGTGQDLLGLRDYQPSDEVRRVDWKATARVGNLIVREYAAEDERRVTVYFDTFLNADTPENLAKFERGVSLTAATVAHFVAANAQIRLIIDDETQDFGADKAKLYESLRRLAVITPTFKKNENQVFPASRPNDFSILLTANDSTSNNQNFSQIINF